MFQSKLKRGCREIILFHDSPLKTSNNYLILTDDVLSLLLIP